MKTKGIVIIAHSKRGYAFAAYNLALSIKRFSNVKVAVIHDECIKYVPDQFFDLKIPLDAKQGPGEIKAGIYSKLPFDFNLIIDADSICLRGIEPIIDGLIEKGGHYYTHLYGTYSGGEWPEMFWATPDQIKSKWNLTGTLQSPNTSLQFVKKCKESKSLFDQWLKNINDPIPLNELKTQWGKTQPDELYLCAALAQKGIDANIGELMFFGSKHSDLTFKEIEEKYSLMTLYGGKGFTKLSYIEWYERLMHKNASHFKLSHNYKTNFIFQDKHVNNK